MSRLALPPGARIHLVGIGGAGMSALAEILHRSGYRVSGSDLTRSPITDHLSALGIPVALGHAAANVEDATLVVRSSAVPEANPEVARARERGVAVLKHAEMIGQISQVQRTLAVAGTSGKTTTTAMLGTILTSAGLDPTILVGGVVPDLGSGARLGGVPACGPGFFVVEADEFDRRFLELHHEIAIVTNVEADHLDYYGTVEQVREAFASFVGRVAEVGWVVVGADDPGSRALAACRPDRTVTYGLTEVAEWRAAGISVNDVGGNDFVVYAHDTLVGQFRLRVPGRHNVANALAAAVAAGRVGVDFTVAAAALERFAGVERRLERKGEVGGITIVDDYAHHPTKIRASLAALREQHAGRIVCLFQPHHYHRLSSLFGDFARAFGDADVVVVTDVYAPAGRGPERGERTAQDLVRAIRGVDATYGGPLPDAIRLTASLARSGDLIVTMGAGDVTRAGPELLCLLGGGVPR